MKTIKNKKAAPARYRLGVDIGRVLMCPSSDDGSPDTSFLSANEREALTVPAAPGCFETFPQLIERFAGEVWLVSKAGPRIEALTQKWLRHQDFFHRTGLRPDRVCFCRKRPEKRIFAERYQLTHFIDDRVDVLTHLRGVVSRLVLFGVQTNPAPPWSVHALNWAEVPRALFPEGIMER